MTSESVLSIFREITKIPRESGHEQKMTAFLVDFAKSHNLQYKKDSTGNVLIIKEATPGKEDVPTLVLQGHQDMVCEKVASSNHDFEKDPIEYVIEDGWMVAKETTLGADDGIGVAACLAILQSDLPTGRLECLFTISEETGMDGAMALESGFFTGKTLINLDSEDEGQLFVGCAGGVNTMGTFSYVPEEVKEGSSIIKITIDGAIGGHSGDDIFKNRCNTLQQMARFLFSVLKADRNYAQILCIDGGNKHNAIARETSAVLAVPEGRKEEFLSSFKTFGENLSKEFSVSDPKVQVHAETVQCPLPAIDSDTAFRLVSCLLALHHGMLAMSQDIEGLVETSNNVASVKMKEGNIIEVCTSQRSSVESAKEFIADKIEAVFTLSGATSRRSDPYPGWKPDMSSHILEVSRRSYVRLFGVEPEIKAIHAGLECGLFLEKFPGLDMISFGPTLRGVHAPGEKLDLASNEKFVRHLCDVVTSFK